MVADEIKTSHDLADLLEDAVRVLRMLPAIELSDEFQSNKPKSVTKIERKQDLGRQMHDRLSSLADQLPSFDRLDAEAEINSLTVPAIRQLASILQVRMPSRATKAESVSLLMSQLFDAPAGQELIRTFHQRNLRPSEAKGFVSPGKSQLPTSPPSKLRSSS